MQEEAPTVFVVPPNAALMCPLHFGVLRDPVDAPCGCTFCRRCISEVLGTKHECPLHGRPIYLDHLRPNDRAAALIDELLIHCKGGVQKSALGEWVPSNSGCKWWISIGKRKDHEDTCPHVVGVSAGVSEAEKPSPPPMKTCGYREFGCLFYGHTDQELLLHQETCGYGKLLQRVEQLQVRLAHQEAEILKLNGLLAEKENTIKSSLPNVNQILESMSRGLERLDEDGTRFFEDAKMSLQRTKSAVFQNSVQVLNSIKEVVESARSEFVAKIEELESAARYKIRSLTQSSSTLRIENAPQNPPQNPSQESLQNPPQNPQQNLPPDVDIPPAPTIITTTSTITTSAAVADDVASSNDANSVISENTNSNLFENSQFIENYSPKRTPAPKEEEEESDESYESDEEIREFLKVSKREYEKDQALRLMEEESVKQAMRLSLLDMEKKNQK